MTTWFDHLHRHTHRSARVRQPSDAGPIGYGEKDLRSRGMSPLLVALAQAR